MQLILENKFDINLLLPSTNNEVNALAGKRLMLFFLQAMRTFIILLLMIPLLNAFCNPKGCSGHRFYILIYFSIKISCCFNELINFFVYLAMFLFPIEIPTPGFGYMFQIRLPERYNQN
jgi:hypothetical protein